MSTSEKASEWEEQRNYRISVKERQIQETKEAIMSRQVHLRRLEDSIQKERKKQNPFLPRENEPIENPAETS